MSNTAMNIALTRIKHNIPEEILTEAFKVSDDKYLQVPIPIFEKIKKYVIRDRVLLDCDLVGGDPTKIPIVINYYEQTKEYYQNGIFIAPQYAVYRIPPEARNNLPIADVMGLSLDAGTGNFSSGGGGASVWGFSEQVLSSRTLSNATIMPIPRLLSFDLVKITPAQMAHTDFVLECRLSYGEDFQNMNSSAIDPWAELCVWATKAYVYNRLKIRIDRAYITGGSDLPTMKEIVDGYADANERYKELLDQFAGGTLLGSERLETLVKFMS